MSDFNSEIKQILIGNILFIICCIFYLAWWLLAFKPSGAISGMKTGWLLIPAFFTGLSGVVLSIWGIHAKTQDNQLLSRSYILWGGIAAYFILLAITVLLFKRQATTELILIVGWGMLALAEVNTLFGSEMFSHKLSIIFVLLISISVVLSLICYILYYRLNSFTGYIDGMIPLLLAALIMVGISCFIMFPHK